jgi:hypothetical protein
MGYLHLIYQNNVKKSVTIQDDIGKDVLTAKNARNAKKKFES